MALLEEARWLYEDRRCRSETVHVAATGLVGAFATIMTLPPVVVALTGGAGSLVRWLMIVTIGTSAAGMIVAVLATIRRKHAAKDLHQVEETFASLLDPHSPGEGKPAWVIRESLAANLTVAQSDNDTTIIRSLSVSTDHQILTYQVAQGFLIAAIVLAAATLTALTLTIA